MFHESLFCRILHEFLDRVITKSVTLNFIRNLTGSNFYKVYFYSIISQNMEPKCDYCATTQAIIYCKYDLAKLCLKCDVHVHSPNPLSRRHMRSLICEKCFSQPAVIRCLDQKVSYCQGCQWHVRSCSALGHRLQSLEPFSGCPSPTEFSRMWSSILEPSVSSLVNPSIGSLPSVDPNNDMFEMSKINELDDLIGSSYSMMSQNITYIQNLSDQSSFFSGDSKVLLIN